MNRLHVNRLFSPNEFEELKHIIEKKSGLQLKDYQQPRIERLLKETYLERVMFTNINWLDEIKKPKSPSLKTIINALTVHYSRFFRDVFHYIYLKETFLPYLFKQKKHLNIWSAATSQGEEAYSLAILLKTFCQKDKSLSFEILASDLNPKKIHQAKTGIYLEKDLKEIPKAFRQLSLPYLLERTNNGQKEYTFNDEIKSSIDFSVLNLLSENKRNHKFDIIFCKNVLFYFNPVNQKVVLKKLHNALTQHGALFIGASECDQELEELHPIEEKAYCCSIQHPLFLAYTKTYSFKS